jgi:hypothetical protein
MINDTDYTFPDGWGLFTDSEKCRWYVEERCFRQAVRQSRSGMMQQFNERGAQLHEPVEE